VTRADSVWDAQKHPTIFEDFALTPTFG